MKILKKIKRQIRNLYKTAKSISNGKWDLFVVAVDLLYSKLRFHITTDEYLKYQFYNLKNRYRKNFLMKSYKKKVTNIVTRDYTSSKFIFYKRIQDLYKRKIILVPHCGEKNFVEFVKKSKHIIVKPDRGSLGRGIFEYTYTDDDDAKKQFSEFSADVPMVCEEFICQHERLKELNPFSVNTIRIVSILNDGEVEIVATILRTGSTSSGVVDNLLGGGIGAQVDVSTGIVSTFGLDYNFNTYAAHPITGVQIIGLKIPHWEEAIELVKAAHKRVPKCLLYGWDVAITPDGVDIVEANNAPGSRIMQVMDRTPRGHKIIKMLKKNMFSQPLKRKAPFVPDYTEAFESEPEMYAGFVSTK